METVMSNEAVAVLSPGSVYAFILMVIAVHVSDRKNTIDVRRLT
jgi:hypothetical protein